ncbi:AI-2E family transporter [Chitinophaga caseinilytica]|uniref:AI-2E family transporter n=1 Tax=Chitinophaga caseinilytica TaxID=2267521 RepID=A0ABZ2YW34_9BACT
MQPVRNTDNLARSLVLVLAGGSLLYFGKPLFVPLFMGLLVAMIMYPVCTTLERWGASRTVGVTVCLVIVIALFAALLALLVWQLRSFLGDWPMLAAKLEGSLTDVKQWLALNFRITLEVQDNWLHDQAGQVMGFIGPVLRGTVNVTANTLFMLFMTPVFAALFLFHRRVFVLFLEKMAGDRYAHKLETILRQVIRTYFQYVKGMILVYLVVGVLNTIGLYLLDVPHAFLFGMLTAIMTIIPYFGIIVSALLPISAAWTVHGSIWYPVGVIGVFSFVQYLEANIIFPKIVAAQLNVSTWATLVAILAGGIVWGVAGMVLFIPFVAMAKIAADHLDEWAHWRLLLARAASGKGSG